MIDLLAVFRSIFLLQLAFVSIFIALFFLLFNNLEIFLCIDVFNIVLVFMWNAVIKHIFNAIVAIQGNRNLLYAL